MKMKKNRIEIFVRIILILVVFILVFKIAVSDTTPIPSSPDQTGTYDVNNYLTNEFTRIPPGINTDLSLPKGPQSVPPFVFDANDNVVFLDDNGDGWILDQKKGTMTSEKDKTKTVSAKDWLENNPDWKNRKEARERGILYDQKWGTKTASWGTSITIGESISFIGQIFNIKPFKSYTNSIDKFFSTSIFNVDYQESKFCSAMHSRRLNNVAAIVNEQTTMGKMATSGAFITGEKSSQITTPDGSTYYQYFIQYGVYPKRSGLSIDVRLYGPGGLTELFNTHTIEDTSLPSQIYTKNITNNYDKVCIEFQGNLQDYFDFVDLNGNKLCQQIKEI